MNVPDILAIAVFVSVAANALHWSGRRNERLFYFPQSGRLRLVFAAWAVAAGVTALLFSTGVIPASAFLGVLVGLTVAYQLYSVGRRQHRRSTST